MKRKSLLLFPAIFAMSLTACASGVKHPIEEYIAGDLEYTSNYRILQLTDTHLGDKDNLDTHFKFMQLTIDEAHPNMIVVTGDLFTFASKSTAKKFFDFLDKQEVPWTVTYGNHDEQCYFSVDWLTGELNKRSQRDDSYCIYNDIQDDDIHGNANFAINLRKGGLLFEQLIVMDSNRYYFGDYFGYDYFKENQIKWYEKLIDYTAKELNGGVVVPSLMFYHIPLPEAQIAWDQYEIGGPDVYAVPFTVKGEPKFGDLLEDVCCPQYNSGFFEVIKNKGSTTGMYFGHDHVNNFILNFEGVDFGYGVKATDRVYYGESKLGGRVIVLHDDHTTSYEDFYHTYAEVK